MTKRTRLQLIAFCVIAALGIAYVGAQYARLPSLFGIGEYTVNLDVPDSGGVFKNSAVTYRGVEIGRVGELELTAGGARVPLVLQKKGVDIPKDTRAVIANRSAIGEQYVDLRPRTTDGPFLGDGDVLTGGREDLPVRVESVLSSVDALARSVPLDPLRTTVDELGKAVAGRGPELRKLSDSLIELSDTGVKTMPQLQKLIRDGAVVLDTQADQSAEIIDYSRDLRTVTEALRDSNSDIERLIDTAPEFTDEAKTLVDRSGQPLTRSIGNLSSTMKALDPLAVSFRVLLQLLPALSAGAQTVAPGDGTIHFGLVLETNNPPACTQGYEGTQKILDAEKAKDPNFDWQEQNFPVNYDADCTVPQGSPTAVRGAHNAKFADPSVPQPWDTKPKVMPDRADLTVAGTQLAELQGLIPR